MKSPPRKFWTEEEKDIARQLAGCGRTWYSVQDFCRTLKSVLKERSLKAIHNQVQDMQKHENLQVPIKISIDYERLDFLLGKEAEEAI